MEKKAKNSYLIFISHASQTERCLLSNQFKLSFEQNNLYSKIKDGSMVVKAIITDTFSAKSKEDNRDFHCDD